MPRIKLTTVTAQEAVDHCLAWCLECTEPLPFPRQLDGADKQRAVELFRSKLRAIPGFESEALSIYRPGTAPKSAADHGTTPGKVSLVLYIEKEVLHDLSTRRCRQEGISGCAPILPEDPLK